jgi:hypothetical protein
MITAPACYVLASSGDSQKFFNTNVLTRHEVVTDMRYPAGAAAALPAAFVPWYDELARVRVGCLLGATGAPIKAPP